MSTDQGEPIHFEERIKSEAEWEAAWQKSVELARQYGWPEELIREMGFEHVTYADRLASMEKINGEDQPTMASWPLC